MIVHGYIKIHPKDCKGWIIVNEIQGFINYTTFILRNISGGGIRCSCKRCKNKKDYSSRCCNDAFSI